MTLSSLRLRKNKIGHSQVLGGAQHALSKVYMHTYTYICIHIPFSWTQRGRIVSIKRTIIFSSIIYYAYYRNNCHPHESFSLSFSFLLFFFTRFVPVLEKTDFPFSSIKHTSAYDVIYIETDLFIF